MEPMQPMKPMPPMQPMERGAPWWPGDLGPPASSGAQDGARYAFFPETHRLAVETDGHVTVYDSGDFRISGVSQQQGGDRQTLAFSSQRGEVTLGDLRQVS